MRAKKITRFTALTFTKTFRRITETVYHVKTKENDRWVLLEVDVGDPLSLKLAQELGQFKIQDAHCKAVSTTTGRLMCLGLRALHALLADMLSDLPACRTTLWAFPEGSSSKDVYLRSLEVQKRTSYIHKLAQAAEVSGTRCADCQQVRCVCE